MGTHEPLHACMHDAHGALVRHLHPNSKRARAGDPTTMGDPSFLLQGKQARQQAPPCPEPPPSPPPRPFSRLERNVAHLPGAQVHSLEPATHAYSFWEGVPLPGKLAFGELFARSRTLKVWRGRGGRAFALSGGAGGGGVSGGRGAKAQGGAPSPCTPQQLGPVDATELPPAHVIHGLQPACLPVRPARPGKNPRLRLHMCTAACARCPVTHPSANPTHAQTHARTHTRHP